MSKQQARNLGTNDFQLAVSSLVKLENKFLELAEEATSGVTFRQEMLYASTAIMNNDYLASCAVKNPLSLRSAFQQVAACGLTLNPARGLSYLVPRDGKVILDISYRGMIRMAVHDGAIKDCIVELVYSKDKFTYQGKRKSPEHSFEPFSAEEERGEFVGVYVEALLPDGRLYVEAIPAREIYTARAASDLWRRKKQGPWVDYFSSMAKKAAIKSARKYWPQGSGKLDEAISYLNTEAGEGFSNQDVPSAIVERYMGAADVVEAEPEVLEGLVVPETEQQASPPADDAPLKETVQAENAAQQQAEASANPVAASDDMPPKFLKRVETLLQRAKAAGAWEAAKSHMSEQGWPEEWRTYALNQLNAAAYAAATAGE